MKHNRGLFTTLFVIGAAALAIYFAILLTRSPADRDELWKEAGKAALLVVTVAVLGTVLTLLADNYKDEQERLARDARFRQDQYDRLVEATNTLRRVPILIKADWSVRTFDEQLLQVVEAGLKLRMIKHQIWSSKDVPDPPFPDYRELTYLLESLYHYTDSVIEEFVKVKEPLLAAQRRAEDADLAPEKHKKAAEKVRLWKPKLPAVDDMIASKDQEVHKECRKQVEQELSKAVRPNDEIPEPEGTWSWLRYEETEKLAFARITEATLEHRRSRGRDPLGGFKRVLQPHQPPRTSY